MQNKNQDVVAFPFNQYVIIFPLPFTGTSPLHSKMKPRLERRL